MSETPAEYALRSELDRLGPDAIWQQPKLIARLALDAWHKPSEVLRHFASSWGWVKHGPDRNPTLELVVTELCRVQAPRSILELAQQLDYLVVRFCEGGPDPKLSLVTDDKRVVDFLATIFRIHDVQVFQGVVPAAAKYDAVICAPPLGDRTKTVANSDGYGGDRLVPISRHLASGGTLCWITARGVLWSTAAKSTFRALEECGLNLFASIEIPPGSFRGTLIEGVVLAFKHDPPKKVFIAAVRDPSQVPTVVQALSAGSGSGNADSSDWAWIDSDEPPSFRQYEQIRFTRSLRPKGKSQLLTLGSVILGNVQKADKPVPSDNIANAFLYVPEYASSRVTADLSEQSVKPKAVFRVPLDTSKVVPQFLAHLLNTPFGRHVRMAAASGITIQRLSVMALKNIELPIPQPKSQQRIADCTVDIDLMLSALEEMRSDLSQNWNTLPESEEKLLALRNVLNIERRIENWWQELPYPLATVYRRYQVSKAPKARFDALLHFFELSAIYLAALGMSYVRDLHADWTEVVVRWLHPEGAVGIERADFGFWIALARASLKELRRITSDVELRNSAHERAGPELVEQAATLGALGRSLEPLDTARNYRNNWIGHGGHIKDSDATRLEGELRLSVRRYYEIAAPTFRKVLLLRPGSLDATSVGYRYRVEMLAGSDPTFISDEILVGNLVKSHELAFWFKGSRIMCHTVPFLRMGHPQDVTEPTVYVFNRVVDGGYRWVSYQEAREQEATLADSEIAHLLSLKPPASS